MEPPSPLEQQKQQNARLLSLSAILQSPFPCITNSTGCIPSLYFIFLMSYLVLPSFICFLKLFIPMKA